MMFAGKFAGKRAIARSVAVVLVLAAAGFVGGGLPVAHAANGTLSSITAVVVADGTVDQAIGSVSAGGNVVVPGAYYHGGVDGSTTVNGILDDSSHNGLVAAQDYVLYSITANYGTVNPGDTLSLVGTLPAGVQWQATSYTTGASGTCNVSGAITAVPATAGTLTCKWLAVAGTTSATFTWIGRVVSPPAFNGMQFQATFKDGNGSVTGAAPSLTVVAAPAADIVMWSCTTSTGTFLAQQGFVLTCAAEIGSWRTYASGDVRGFEAPAAPYTVGLKVPPDGLWMGISGAPADITGVQPGGAGGLVTITVNRAAGAAVGGNGSSVANFGVQVFVPFITMTPNVAMNEPLQFVNFDPDSLSGQSNYGDGYTLNQATPPLPDPNCVANGMQYGTQCYPFSITYRNVPLLNQGIYFYGSLAGASLYGATGPNGGEMVLPGQSFVTLQWVNNDLTTNAPMLDTASCLTWDSNLATLQGPGQMRGPSTVVSVGVYAGPTSSLMTAGPALPPANYQLEYAAVPALVGAPAAALSSFACGAVGSGNTTATWVTDPTTLSGGVTSVNAVRWVLDVPLQPADMVGLVLPLQRTTTPQSLALISGSGRIYFYNAATFTGQSPSPAKTSNNVVAVDALVRERTLINGASSTTRAGGQTVVFTVTPAVVGPPVAGLDMTAKGVTLRLSFDSACVDLSVDNTVASLQAQLALAGYPGATVTVTSPGAGLAACAGGSTSGPVITISYGDVVAPGANPPGGVPTVVASAPGVNMTVLGAALQVPVVFSLLTPQGTVAHLTTMIASPTDPTMEQWSYNPNIAIGDIDRNDWAWVTVNTPQSLEAGKQATLASGIVVGGTSGTVAPGESFSYQLKMQNTQLDDYGLAEMVDVLPFPGADPRVIAPAVNGLGAGSSLRVTAVSAAMYDSFGNTAPVAALCSTADPATLYAALQTDVAAMAGFLQVDALAGWVDCSVSVPSGVTAVKFVTSAPLAEDWTVEGAVEVTTPCIVPGGVMVNNMSYLALPGGHGTLAEQEHSLTPPVRLVSTAAALSGTVSRDINFSGTFDGPDGVWPADGSVAHLLDAATGAPVMSPCSAGPLTAPVGAGGAYSFPSIPAGTYLVSLTGTPAGGPVTAAGAPYNLIATNTTSNSAAAPPVWSANPAVVNSVTVAAGTSGAVDNLLYQEPVAAPSLAPDARTVRQYGSVTIPVAASLAAANNDTVAVPLAVDAIIPGGAQTVLVAPTGTPDVPVRAYAGGVVSYPASPGWGTTLTTSNGGTVTVNGDGTITYQAGSYTGVDTFDYAWTNVYGVTSTTTVTITATDYTAPAIQLTGALAVGSAGDTVGDTIVWTYLVTNLDGADLTDVTISDDLGLANIVCGLADTPNGSVSLAADASVTCTGTSTVTQADLDNGYVPNSATVSGKDPDLATVESLLPSSAQVMLLQDPVGTITKTASLSDANGNGLADVGETVGFTVVIANSGNVTLHLVTLTDSMPALTLTCPQPNGSIVLAPNGGSITCTTSSYTVTAADVAAGVVRNTVSLTGQAGTVDPETRAGSAGAVTGSSSVTVPTARASAHTANTGGSSAPPGLSGPLAGAGLVVLGGWLLWWRRRFEAGGAF